jgi:hypothetical protein
MGVATGAMSIVESGLEQKTWVWTNEDLRSRLPYDIGIRRDNGDFLPVFVRGAALPAKARLTRNVSALTLYRRDYDGQTILLGRLRFNGTDKPSIVVNKNREIQSVEGVTVDRTEPIRDRNQVPMLEEVGGNISHW